MSQGQPNAPLGQTVICAHLPAVHASEPLHFSPVQGQPIAVSGQQLSLNDGSLQNVPQYELIDESDATSSSIVMETLLPSVLTPPEPSNAFTHAAGKPFATVANDNVYVVAGALTVAIFAILRFDPVVSSYD